MTKRLKEFQNEPLSESIVLKLINASEKIAELKMMISMSQDDVVELFNAAVLLREFRYYNALNGDDYSVEQLVLAMYGYGDIPDLIQLFLSFQNSKIFINQHIQEHEIITAIEYLRVNLLLNSKQMSECTDEPEIIDTHLLEEVGEILTDLYCSNKTKLPLLELTISIYRLFQIQDAYGLNGLLFDFLLMSWTKSAHLTVGLSKAWIIYDIKDKIQTSDVKSCIEAILDCITYAATESADLFHKLKSERKLLEEHIELNIPDYPVNKLFPIIYNNVLLHNSNIQEQLSVSPKTALGYIKALEQNGSLTARRFAREKIYLNQWFLKLMDDGL